MTKKQQSNLLVLGALGIVFGDIGTSPLYALQAIFGTGNHTLDASSVTGVISLILWSITIVVTIKYILILMRIDNKGEGGTMALIGLLQQSRLHAKRKVLWALVGLVGVSLFYGDSVITPAISLLSAVEGTKLIAPQFSEWIVPLTIVILIGLFWIQSRGTGVIGKIFGPAMLAWFAVSALGGLGQIIAYPAILTALLPTTAFEFFLANPLFGFIAMGAVILAITGAEALYADMGHFGRIPIAKAWLWVVFPALALNYLGQGALVVQYPEAITSSYFLLFPAYLQLPVILLAMLATLIASQAVISGAFSLTRQAVQLGYAPRLTIAHTSREEIGQVYIPVLNWLLGSIVLVIVVLFGSSEKLAAAFGMAVSGTLAVSTLLLLVILRAVYQTKWIWVILASIVFLTIDILFVSSSLSKLLHGAWLPLALAVVSFTILSTWHKGDRIISAQRHRIEETLASFMQEVRRLHPPRVTGDAIYLGHHIGNAPLALRSTLEQLHELHRRVVVVTVQTAHVAHIPLDARVEFDGLGDPSDGISHVTLRFGFKDIPNVPHALHAARKQSHELDIDLENVTYFLSPIKPTIVKNHRMSRFRKLIYVMLDRNKSSSTDFFKLPLERTIEMTSRVEL